MSRPLPTKLSVLRRKFVDAMLLGMCQTQAAVHCGLDKSAGHRIVREPLVVEALAKGRQRAMIKTGYTRSKAIKLLFEAIEMSKVLRDPTSMIRAIQELNRMFGYQSPVVHELHLSEDLAKRQRQIQEMSDEQLLKLAKLEEKVIEGEVIEAEVIDEQSTESS